MQYTPYVPINTRLVKLTLVHPYNGPSSGEKVEEVLSVRKWKDSLDKPFNEQKEGVQWWILYENHP